MSILFIIKSQTYRILLVRNQFSVYLQLKYECTNLLLLTFLYVMNRLVNLYVRILWSCVLPTKNDLIPGLSHYHFGNKLFSYATSVLAVRLNDCLDIQFCLDLFLSLLIKVGSRDVQTDKKISSVQRFR